MSGKHLSLRIAKRLLADHEEGRPVEVNDFTSIGDEAAAVLSGYDGGLFFDSLS
jgi:hypothetical protein